MIGALVAGFLVLADANVAVLCADSPRVTCSTVQPRLEAELMKRGLTLVRVPPASGALAGEPPSSEQAVADAKREMDEGVKLFYEGVLPAAKIALEKANASIAAATIPAARERVEIHLWRATVAYASTDIPGGNSAVREALTIDPDHVVNTTVFSTDLKEIVDDEKKKLSSLARVQLTFSDVRERSEIKIDDKRVEPADGKVSVLKGRHWLTATAPGYQPLWRSFDASLDTTLSVALSPALPQEVEAAIRTKSASPLMDFAKQIDADTLIVVSVRPQNVGVLVITRDLVGAERIFLRRDAIAAMADFAVAGLGPSVTIRPTPGPKSYALRPSGAIAVSVWRRDLDIEGYQPVNLVGAGPSVSLDLEFRGAIAHVDAMFLHYGVNKIVSKIDASGTEKERNGGTATHLSAGVGYQVTFGRGSYERGLEPRVLGRVGFATESYESIELRNNEGVLPMYGSHDRRGPFFRVEAAYPLGTVLLRGGGGAWISGYEETPEGVNGRDPRTDPIPMLNVGIEYKANDRLLIAGDLRAQIRNVTYGSNPDDGSNAIPAVRGATLAETHEVVGVTVRYNF